MTTTKKPDLKAVDFMMMDIHRPPTQEEIDHETMVDKTEQVPPEVTEQPSERCDTCFAPMPCEAHANVEPLQVTTTHDISPTSVLAQAHNAGLKEVIVVGMRDDGTEYFASNIADAAPCMYHLQRGIHKLNKMIDGDFRDDDDEGPASA